MLAVPTVTFNKGTYFANEGNTLTIEIMRDGDGGDDITVGKSLSTYTFVVIRNVHMTFLVCML